MIRESMTCTIVIGSSQESRTIKNPFTCNERIFMIKNIYGNLPYLNIFCLEDIKNNDEWYNYVLNNIKDKSNMFAEPDAYYCGGIEEGEWFNKGKLKIEILDRTTQSNIKNISGTKIRNMMKLKNSEWESFIPENNRKYLKDIIKNNNIFN